MAEEFSVDELISDFEKDSSNANCFKIAISKDQMEVTMYPADILDGGFITLEEVINACKRENIKVEIDEKLVEKQLHETNPVEIAIAKGIKPTDGKDGYIEYKFNMSAKPQFIPEDGHSVDYKAAMQIALVKAGDILADVIPPTEGKDGMDVRGEPLKAENGSPAKYFLGEGLEEKDGHLIATTAGTPSVKDGLITIRRSYILQGDVDLSTGNINFPGTVVIHGNVTDGFEVVSEENIVVNGLIAGAKIKAKGYVKCAGGIQGNGRAEIISGSYITAKFINAATVVAEGDILVTKNAMHSNISCLGELRLGGSIIGGVATVFKSVECAELGSETGTKTIVNIRTHYRQEKARKLVNSIIEETNTIFERYLVWNNSTYISETEEEFSQIISKLQGLITKRQMYDSKVARFDALVFENKTAKVKLLGTLEADVTVASPYSKYTSTVPIRGPLIVTENNFASKMAVAKGG